MEHPHPQSQRPQHPLANYQFNSEELRVLRECNTESFFQRSLPLGTALGVAAFLGVKNGYLQPNLKYGSIPKIVVGVVIGYFMGKFSYQQKCAEKLMQLPNSKLAEVLRQRKKDGVMGRLNPDQNLSLALAAPFSPSMPNEEHAQRNSRSSALNLDTESRPSISGLDDIYRPSLDSSTSYLEPELPLETAKPGTTYEELRKRNREEYGKKVINPYAHSLSSDSSVTVQDQEASKPLFDREPELFLPKGSKNKNKYGDSWTD